MHTISAEQLLKAYNGKYKYVTVDSSGCCFVWDAKPTQYNRGWVAETKNFLCLHELAITEFQGEPWDACIYKAKPSEEDWVGTLCFFADSAFGLNDQRIRDISVLSKIDKEDKQPYLSVENDKWTYCRPVRPDEIKFFNDDTAEE